MFNSFDLQAFRFLVKPVADEKLKGVPDHVGIVETVQDSVITVIEGNIKDSVGRRKIKVNGKNIRGYGVPGYAGDEKSIDQLAEEVLSGKWGNGEERKNRLTAAGYDAAEVQKRVNEILR